MIRYDPGYKYKSFTAFIVINLFLVIYVKVGLDSFVFTCIVNLDDSIVTWDGWVISTIELAGKSCPSFSDKV